MSCWSVLARVSACYPPWGSPRWTAGQAAQARLFEVLLGLVVRLGQQTPVAIVVEDLRWSDQSTRDLVAFLVRNLRRNRVLMVVTYRSDEPGSHRLEPWLAELDRGGPVQRLELPRLERAQTAARRCPGTPAADLVDQVFARSEATRSSLRSCWRRRGPALSSYHRH